MAPLKKPGRPYYYIRITLPAPWKRVGPWSSGFATKRQAEAVESWVRQMAMERPELIDALVRGDFTVREAWIAKVRGTLDGLLEGLTDPLLSATAAALQDAIQDGRVKHGLAELSGLADTVEMARAVGAKRRAPKAGTVRTSWLLEPRNVQDLYAAALEGGRSANSVQRSVHRAVADLLAHHYSKARRNAVMAEVRIPRTDDERKVSVTGSEIAAILAECDVEFRDMVALAMLLAVDRGPLLRITPRYFGEEAGTLEVLDTKTASRPRTIELSTPAWAILRRRCTTRKRDERIFGYTDNQVRHLWEAARDRAAGVPSRNKRERGVVRPARVEADRLLGEQRVVTLPVLRFKDLRHLLPTAWNALGFSPTDLQEILGHAKGSKQTERYITARVSGEREKMDQVAAYLGLDRHHLRAAGE